MRAPVFENPYAARGRWWKVAIHCHTTNSDGRIAPERAVRAYARRGFDALAITDHNFVTRVPSHRGRPVLIAAAEMSGIAPDMLWLGAKAKGALPRTGRSLQAVVDGIRRKGGLAFLAHPSWSSLRSAEVGKLRGCVGLEIYNQLCNDLTGKGVAVEMWDHLLGMGLRFWGLADDDTHFDPSWSPPGQAYHWVKAERLTPQAILSALARGAFHATQGPRFLRIEQRGRGRFRLLTTRAERLHIISDGIGGGGTQRCDGRANDGTRWTVDVLRARINVGRYVRFELVDERGRLAWTNPFYVKGAGLRFW